MEDLEGEDRRAERRSEQHREAGGHPGDGQDAEVAAVEVVAARDPAPERAGGLHERRLRADRAAGRDPDDRHRDERPQVADVVASAADVDVVDEQLDVAGIAEQPGQHRDHEPGRGEDAELGPAVPVGRSEELGEAAQRPDERRAREPGREPDHDDEREEVAAGWLLVDGA